MARLKDAEHLLRLAAVFLAGFLLFLLLRSQLVPKSFGQYGHYRGNALAENASKAVKYAGHKACEDCHADILETKLAGKHKGVNCEACHGPLANHAEDPAAVVPQLPDTKVLCARCHEANAAKPSTFPQVVTKDHAGDAACNSCHKPHTPSMDQPVAQEAKKKS
ncbi:MAG TPA: multiheme c-type cytochrome [Terriglobales bacterium]|nr:multiheme c-type cytochrome [Terriglobales bacterium]